MQLPAPGDVVDGRYRVDAVVGEGAAARVYAATTLGLDRRVALKVLKPDGRDYDPVRKARFQREAAILGQLRDPHTVEIFDVGESAEGLLFLVSELVDGLDLAELLSRRGTLSEAETLHILRQVLSSLAEAHELGMVHRDVKPGNIRVFRHLDDPLRVKVLDFGLASAVAMPDTGLTGELDLLGTPRYMSPELLAGERVTPAADVFSAGLVALELFRGGAALQNRFGDPEFARRAVHGTSRLEALLRGMLASTPTERYADAGAALRALDNAAPIPAPIPAPTATHEAARAPAHEPGSRLRGASMVALGAGAALVIGAMWFGLDAARPEQRPRYRLGAADAGTEQRTPLTIVRQHTPPPRESAAAPDLAMPEPTLDAGEPDALVPADVASAASDEDPARPCRGERPFVGAGVVEGGGTSWEAKVPVWLPPTYNGQAQIPLVLYFTHSDDARDPMHAIRASRLPRVADRHGFAIASVHFTSRDDLGEVRTALQTAERKLCIDPERIFAVGAGTGGELLHSLRCALPVAAIATIGQRDVSASCAPGEGPSQIHFAPRGEFRLPLEGGQGCDGRREIASLREFEAHASAEQDCRLKRQPRLYGSDSDCAVGVCRHGEFVSCKIDGGPVWTRRSTYSGCREVKPSQFDYAEHVWKFFDEVTQPGRRAGHRPSSSRKIEIIGLD